MALAMRGQVKKRVLGADDMWAWAACEFGLSDAGVVFGEEIVPWAVVADARSWRAADSARASAEASASSSFFRRRRFA